MFEYKHTKKKYTEEKMYKNNQSKNRGATVIKGTMIIRIILITALVILTLSVMSCNTVNTVAPNPGTSLTINISTLCGGIIVSERVVLKNNLDDSITHYEKFQSNRITFSQIDEGTYSLFIEWRLIDDSINVNEGVNTLHLLLDNEIETNRITILNNTGGNLHTL